MTEYQYSDIFKRLYLPLGMFALRYCAGVADAEDVVQEAFATVWRRMSLPGAPENVKAYLYMTVRNIALDRLRHDATRAKEISLDMVLATDEVSEEDIDTSERDARLWREIDRLPDRCREIFLMSKRDGLSNKEIAEDLGVSVKTVENQMTKALSRLRKAFADIRSGSVMPVLLPFL